MENLGLSVAKLGKEQSQMAFCGQSPGGMALELQEDRLHKLCFMALCLVLSRTISLYLDEDSGLG